MAKQTRYRINRRQLLWGALTCCTLLLTTIGAEAKTYGSYQIAQFRREATPEPSNTPIPLPRFYARHVEEGNKLLAQNRISEAMEEFFTAKTINPDYYPTYVGMGNAYKMRGQLEQAMEQYQIAVRLLNPSYASEDMLRAEYFAERRQYRQAIDSYWEVLRIDPQAGNYYTLAMRHLRFGNDRQAIKAFEEAANIDDDYAAPHFQLGNLYFRDNKLQKAVDPYKKAVQMEPNNPLYRFGLGTALYKQATSKSKPDMRMVGDATYAFEQALKLGMQVPRLHFNLGTCYILAQRHDDAIRHLEEAVKRGLRDEDAFYNLGNAYFAKGMTSDFTWDGYDNLADPKLLNQNNTKFGYLLKSVYAYEAALKQKSDYAQVYYDLGAAFYRLSELKLTEPFQKAMLQNEATQKDYATRGVKFFREDMLNQAIANFKSFQSYSSDTKKRTNASKIVDGLQVQLKELRR